MQLGWIKVGAAGALSMCPANPFRKAYTSPIQRTGAAETQHHDSGCYLFDALDVPPSSASTSTAAAAKLHVPCKPCRFTFDRQPPDPHGNARHDKADRSALSP
jgi:hypothetical protein